MPVTEPLQNILHLLLCLPSSSPSPLQFWTPFECCQYWSSLGSAGNIISAQVYLQPLARPLTLLSQCLTARLFRITLSQAAAFQVAHIPKGLAYTGWLIRAQIAHEFSVHPTIIQNNCGCRVTWRSFRNSSPWVGDKHQNRGPLLSPPTVAALLFLGSPMNL